MFNRLFQIPFGKPIFTQSGQTSVMRLVFFPALALSLFGAWMLPGGEERETWTGPVVLNKAPPPPSTQAYEQAFAAAWAPAPRTAPLPTQAPLPAANHYAPVQQAAYPEPDIAAGEAQLRAVINDDIARMKAMGIGAQVAQTAESTPGWVG